MSTKNDDIDNLAQSIFFIFLFIFIISDTSYYVNKIVKDDKTLKKYDYLKNSIYVIYQFIFNKYETDENNNTLIVNSYTPLISQNIKIINEEVEEEDEEEEVEEEEEV